MSTTTQLGEFTVGAVGLHLRIQLDASLGDDFDLSNVSTIVLKFTPPDGTEVSRTLAPPDGVIGDPADRIIQYTLQTGDLTVAGVYTFSLTITFSGTGSPTMVANGSFTVRDAPSNDLKKEDGSGMDDANSYADVEDADLYHARHLYPEAWLAASFDRKAVALMMSTRMLDAHWTFRGARSTDAQALSWPRVGVLNRERESIGLLIESNMLAGLASYGAGFWSPVYPANIVPVIVIAATCEFARLLLESNRNAEDPTMGLSGFSLGSGALSFQFNPADRKPTFTPEVVALLSPVGSQTVLSTGFKKLVRA